MNLIRPFLPFVTIGLLLIFVVDAFLLGSLGFGQIEVLLAFAFPILFGWVLGGFVPERHWGSYFTLAWVMVLAAPFALRVRRGSMMELPTDVFVILFAAGCMFATQSLRMLSRLDRDALASQNDGQV